MTKTELIEDLKNDLVILEDLRNEHESANNYKAQYQCEGAYKVLDEMIEVLEKMKC